MAPAGGGWLNRPGFSAKSIKRLATVFATAAAPIKSI